MIYKSDEEIIHFFTLIVKVNLMFLALVLNQ